ncbi:methyltransferase regulatory domain-containing protein [Streptobacillus moniliformis]|uniref:methyltransferase regulatory domain-containing protein n=1 Tax=Streptobacillus moniliformis TaxID=34105 RepID=UPI0007E3B61A|nr:class I SAM-dependent methyltransferase [Streptobacillus moniliformis]
MNDIKELEKSYDSIPYISKSFKKCQPLHLKTMMKMLSFETTDLDKMRVLEIGCSFGGNIIPIAISNPNSEVIGLDLSKVQIDEGNDIIEKIGLKNIKLYHKNIVEYNNEFGKFDYIICHGVFSWVPDEVKEAILKVVKSSLTENGVAVISYNTYPGWKRIDVARDLMLFSIENLKDRLLNVNDQDKVEMGKSAIRFYLDNSIVDENMKDVLKNLLDKDTHYLYHEYFEKYNDPMYFYEFSKMLAKHNLIHVVDSSMSNSYPNFNQEVKTAINNECSDNRIAKEQYYDFLRNAQFRTSIITHSENSSKVNLTDEILLERLDDIYVRGVYSLEDGKWKYGETELYEQNDKLLKYLTDIYPKNIKIKKLVEKFGKDEYYKIYGLIYRENIEYDIYERGTSDESQIGPMNLNYLKYCFGANSKITFSSYKGEILELPEYLTILVDLLYESNLDSLKDKIVEKFETGELVSNAEKDFSKLADLVIKDIKRMVKVYELYR